MAKKSFNKVHFNEPQLRRLVDHIGDAFKQFEGSAIISGTIVKDIVLVSGTSKRVDHGLGRDYLGYIVIDKNSNANIFTSGTDQKNKYITLQSTANTTISLWIF